MADVVDIVAGFLIATLIAYGWYTAVEAYEFSQAGRNKPMGMHEFELEVVHAWCQESYDERIAKLSKLRAFVRSRGAVHPDDYAEMVESVDLLLDMVFYYSPSFSIFDRP